jgi:hypothetical protein
MEAALASDSRVAQAEWTVRRLSVRAIAGGLSGDALRSRLSSEVDSLRNKAPGLDRLYPNLSTYLLLGVGYVAARAGDVPRIGDVLEAVPEGKVQGVPVLHDLREVLVAERETASGRPRAAIARLSALAGNARATFPVHSALKRAARAAGDDALAARKSQWLATHRGRAYVEEGADYFPTPFNILDTRAREPGRPGRD